MLQVGTVLSRGYTIERILGQGGMGAVYLAQQTQLGRLVAIKETMMRLSDPGEQALAREQFQKEARILASLEHPGLVDVKDFFEDGDAQYLVMAFVDGETLEAVVNRTRGYVAVDDALEWTIQLCDVLAYLHSHDPPVLIRDVKPANVMLEASGRVRLIDFGIARFCLPQQETVAILKGAGTIGFAPPEQFAGTQTDARSDIYSLGATLYAVLTRRVPPWSVALATGQETLPPPSTYNPAISRDLEAVILGMMALRKELRYPSATAVKAALQGLRPPVAAPVVAGPRDERRFCPHCGAGFHAAGAMCPTCGDPLEGPASPPVSASTPPATAGAGGGWPPDALPPSSTVPHPVPAPSGAWPVVPPPAAQGMPPGAAGGTAASGGWPAIPPPGPPGAWPGDQPPREVAGQSTRPPRGPSRALWAAIVVVVVTALGFVSLKSRPSSSPQASPSPVASASAVVAPSPGGSVAPGPTASGAITPAEVGMETETMTREMARDMGVSFVFGARVTRVTPGSPAAQADIQAGDVITWIGIHRVWHRDDVAKHLEQRKRNEVIRICNLHNKSYRWSLVQVPR